MGGSSTNVYAMRAIGALAQDAGLQVLEAAGWEDRGRTWSTLRPDYVVCHHTAATVDVDRILIDGRSDLPGPLCNFALHRNGTVVLIASGLANHAGVATISSDQAWGIEATGPIPIDGFGPGAFPNYQAYVTLVAAIRLHHGWSNGRVLAHKEIARPLGRKIDPSTDMDTFRTQVEQRVRTWGLEDSDMYDAAAEQRLKDWIEGRLDVHNAEVVALVKRLVGNVPAEGLQGSLSTLAHGRREDGRESLDTLAGDTAAILDALGEPPA